jgi:hypothetical protein
MDAQITGAEDNQPVAPMPVAVPTPSATLQSVMSSMPQPGAPAAVAAPKKRLGLNAWLALGVFVVLGGLMLTPVLPGFVVKGLPGSSGSFVYSGQGIACSGVSGTPVNTVKYNTKMGFPLVYNFDSISALQMNCDGVSQSANGSETIEFSPLAIAADLAVAAVLAALTFLVVGRMLKRG